VPELGGNLLANPFHVDPPSPHQNAGIARNIPTSKPRHWSPSSRLKVTLAPAELWFVVNTFIGSTTLFAYPFEMSDGTTAWCHTGTVSVAISWTLCCFLSGLSVELVMIQHQPPQPDEGAHDGNIHLDRSLAPENARKHRDTLFRGSTGEVTTTTPADL